MGILYMRAEFCNTSYCADLLYAACDEQVRANLEPLRFCLKTYDERLPLG